MNTLSRDIWRWVLTFILTFATAAIQGMTDQHFVLADIVRHGFIGLLPSIAALKMTLEGGQSNDKAKGASA
jgi:hypothetical protein